MIRKGFTLMEILVVMTLFSIVSITAINLYVNNIQNSNKTNLHANAYRDAQNFLNSLANAIMNSQIDYEEYFSQCVIQAECPILTPDDNIPPSNTYGLDHGYYAWQFYHGGFQDRNLTITDGYGEICHDRENNAIRAPSEECVTVPLGFSEDSNTGVNPATLSIVPDEQEIFAGSAFCQNGNVQLFGTTPEGIKVHNSGRNCNNQESMVTVKELYLYNEVDSTKTIFARGLIGEDNYVLMKTELEEIELASEDQVIYPIKVFGCKKDYNCTLQIASTTSTEDARDLNMNTLKILRPKKAVLADPDRKQSDLFTDFVPISPMNLNISNLEFVIHPTEDFKLAHREPNLSVASITIKAEFEPSKKFKLPFFSKNFNIKLETTITTKLAQNDEL